MLGFFYNLYFHKILLMQNDKRWQERFENYEKAFFQLKRFLEKGELNEFEIQGLIKSFEYTYELSWKLLKDYLNYQGITGITGSRDAIRHAFNKELIIQGNTWMRMIEDRILTVHTYDSITANEISDRIINLYAPCFEALWEKMKSL